MVHVRPLPRHSLLRCAPSKVPSLRRLLLTHGAASRCTCTLLLIWRNRAVGGGSCHGRRLGLPVDLVLVLDLLQAHALDVDGLVHLVEVVVDVGVVLLLLVEGVEGLLEVLGTGAQLLILLLKLAQFLLSHLQLLLYGYILAFEPINLNIQELLMLLDLLDALDHVSVLVLLGALKLEADLTQVLVLLASLLDMLQVQLVLSGFKAVFALELQLVQFIKKGYVLTRPAAIF